MQLNDKIISFVRLGDFLLDKDNKEEILSWIARARNQNGWFTEDNVILSLESIATQFLRKEQLVALAEMGQTSNPKFIGLVLAGNIPAVGFHDMLCVLMSGHRAMLKLSSSDSALMMALVNKLYSINEAFRDEIQIVDKLNEADAFIATGSDNSAKYFEYYFAKKPHIIRRNRSSVAVLSGNENKIELANLGNDIFQYFGLGCRNISKLYVPDNYDFTNFFESIAYWNTILIHHKYNNNYDYNKSIYLVNKVPHLDNGFLLLKEDESLTSPIGVLFYEQYHSPKHLEALLKANEAKIQCVVSSDKSLANGFEFGQAQLPTITDFADGVNTMEFLAGV